MGDGRVPGVLLVQGNGLILQSGKRALGNRRETLGPSALTRGTLLISLGGRFDPFLPGQKTL